MIKILINGIDGKMGQMLLVNQNAASIIAYLATNLDSDTLLEVNPETNKAILPEKQSEK